MSKQGVAWWAGFGIMLVIAYQLPSRWSTDIVLFMGLLLILDSLHYLGLRKRIKIHIEVPVEIIEKGRTLPLSIVVRNKSYLPTAYVKLTVLDGYRLQLMEPDELCIWLGSKQVTRAEVTYEAQLCGEQLIGLESATLRDFLGIFKWEIPIQPPLRISVMPIPCTLEANSRVFRIYDFYHEVGSVEERLRKDGELITSQLEPYQLGDAMRLIHWKLFAKDQVKRVRQRAVEYDRQSRMVFVLHPISDYRLMEEEQEAMLDWTISILLLLVIEQIKQLQRPWVCYYTGGKWHCIQVGSEQIFNELRWQLSHYEGMESGELEEAKEQVDQLMEEALTIFVSESMDDTLRKWLGRIEVRQSKVVLTSREVETTNISDEIEVLHLQRS